MNQNQFQGAGYASIIAAVVLPLAFTLEGMHQAAVATGLLDWDPGIGLSDLLFLLFALLSIYAYLKLKHLMYEYFSFRKIDLVIAATIIWHAIFFGGSFILEITLVPLWPADEIGLSLLLGSFWIIGMAVFGIIDILIGIIILRQREEFPTVIRVFAWLSVVAGFLEGSIILSPFSLPVVMAMLVTMGVIFLRRLDSVEIV